VWPNPNFRGNVVRGIAVVPFSWNVGVLHKKLEKWNGLWLRRKKWRQTEQEMAPNRWDVRSKAGLPDGMHVFKPKILIWVNFGGSCIGRCWYNLWTVGLLVVVCYILWTFGIVRGHLVYFPHFGMLYVKKSGDPEFDRGPRRDAHELRWGLFTRERFVCWSATGSYFYTNTGKLCRAVSYDAMRPISGPILTVSHGVIRHGVVQHSVFV
jgi:hypothetical protein